MKTRWKAWLGFCGLSLFVPWTVWAATGPIVLGSDEVVADNYVRTGTTITIDGTVEEDAVLMGRELTINGTVKGDLLAIATTVNINGSIEGSVRIIANEVVLRGHVGRNATLAANIFTFTQAGTVDRSLSFATAEAILEGTIERNVTGYSLQTTVNGSMSGHADFTVPTDNLTFGERAAVAGNLVYHSAQELSLPTEQVAGSIERQPGWSLRSSLGLSGTTFWVIYIIGLLIVGLLVMFLFPRGTEHILGTMQRQPFKNMVWGIAVLLGIPIIATVLTLSVVGLPLAVLLLGVYGVFIYLSPAFIGLAIGQQAWHWLFPEHRPIPILPTIAGVMIYYILTLIPYLGWWFWLAGLLWFLGSVARRKVRSVQEREGLLPAAQK